MGVTEEQAKVMLALKSSDGDRFAIKIKNQVGCEIGFLFPITYVMSRALELNRCLSRWRQVNMGSFLTSFSSTPEKSKIYLETMSLPDPARILFLIADEACRPIGNIGLCKLESEEVELDNVLRGEVAHSGLMRFAQASLLQWAFEVLNVQRVVLAVLSENERALGLYARSGFKRSHATPLHKQITEDGYLLRPVSTVAESNHSAQLIYMTLIQSEFYSVHDWIRVGDLQYEVWARPTF